MKKLSSSLVLLALFSTILIAQDKKNIDGVWLGALEVQGTELRLGFTITGSEEGKLEGMFNSIDQGRAEFPADEMVLLGDTLTVSSAQTGVLIKGIIDPVKKTWDTEFSQAGYTAPMLFKKVEKLPE